MSPAPGTSGPSRQGGMLHPGSFGSSGDVLFGTSPSSYSGRGLMYPQSSSLPGASSFQHGSTPPPFGYMTNYDGGASNSFDLPRPSPPYYPISSSLNSTSPHLGPSQLTTIMDRRQSWRKSSNSATLTQLSVSLVCLCPLLFHMCLIAFLYAVSVDVAPDRGAHGSGRARSVQNESILASLAVSRLEQQRQR